VRRLLVLIVTVAALLSIGHATASSARQDLTVTMADGTKIAATLWLPDGTPPPGGWPAIVLFHGLGGSREDMNKLAQLAFLPGDKYAVLAYDARGHGQSGGLISVDGPNEISDANTMFHWLADRPDVSDTKIGAFGISLGGGAVWNSLVAGVPWAAIEVCETWTNLATALMPQGLAKSGVIAGFVNALPAAKIDPSVLAARDAAYAGNLAAVQSFAAARSSISKLKGVKTPVFMMQGRRDFAFGLDQAFAAWPLLAGPKHLWIGLHGHPPSTFPAPDTPAMLLEGRQWFDHYLLGAANGIDKKPRVEVAPVAWKGKTRGFSSVRALANSTLFPSLELGSSITIAPSGRIVSDAGSCAPGPGSGGQFGRTSCSIVGAPTVTLLGKTTGGWSRLVAILIAKTKAGNTVVVSGGGVPARPGSHHYRIRMISQLTFVPAGAKLQLTIGSSSLAQDPSDLLYLQLPIPGGARVTVDPGSIHLTASTTTPGL
jgi:pimeloyl-ACP methyl ester carboxylesterase